MIAMDGGQVPTGTLITFSVTYQNGEQEIIKEHAGTARCDRLLQLALDSNAALRDPFVLGKNQLPAGSYLVGRDIPAGTFDFTWVFGSGSVTKYKNDRDTTLGACNYFQYMGNQEDYQYRQCLNVECLDGENLVVQGNLVIQISRAKKPQIDL